MFDSTATILKAVAALEKCAEIFDKEEKALVEKKAEQVKKDYIEPIRETFTDLNPAFATKLANLDPEILGWIKSAVVHTRATEDYSLGGPSVEKTAGEFSDSILAFISGDD